jgi:hypothetical protein
MAAPKPDAAAQEAMPGAAASSALLADPHTMAQIYAMANPEEAEDARSAEVKQAQASKDLAGSNSAGGGGRISLPRFGRRQSANFELSSEMQAARESARTRSGTSPSSSPQGSPRK